MCKYINLLILEILIKMYKKLVKKRGRIYSYYYHNVREQGRIKNICLGSDLRKARERLNSLKKPSYNLLDNAPIPGKKFEINIGKVLTVVLILILGFGFLYFFNEITGLVVYENTVNLEVNNFVSSNAYVNININNNEYIKSINEFNLELINESYYVENLSINLEEFNLGYGSHNINVSLFDNNSLIASIYEIVNIEENI